MSKHGPTVLIDGHNLFIRNYVRSPYLSANGERAGGTTGSVISVRKIVNDLRASNVLVVWDGEGGSQRRRSIYKEYKAGRTVRLNKREDDMAETPEERMENMRRQRSLAMEYLTMLGIPQVRCDGVEADDLMAWTAANLDQLGGTVIVTTDQDLLQLIRSSVRQCDCTAGIRNPDEASLDQNCSCIAGDEQANIEHHPNCLRREGIVWCEACERTGVIRQSEVRVWSPIKKVMYDRQRFISDYGVLPENFRLVKALTGDSSDNIEGIRGFGEKTVAKSFPFLAERRVTADDVLNTELKGVLGKRLEDGKSRFLENLTLVDLSEPMLSATAARQAREALVRDLGCREVDFRVRLVRDGLSFGGDNFVGPFRDLVLRRRRLLAEQRFTDFASELPPLPTSMLAASEYPPKVDTGENDE